MNACDGQAGPDLKALAPNLASLIILHLYQVLLIESKLYFFGFKVRPWFAMVWFYHDGGGGGIIDNGSGVIVVGGGSIVVGGGIVIVVVGGGGIIISSGVIFDGVGIIGGSGGTQVVWKPQYLGQLIKESSPLCLCVSNYFFLYLSFS